MTNRQKFVEIPLEWFKKPVGMFALCMTLTGGGNVAMNKLMGSPSEQTARIEALEKRVVEYNQEKAVQEIKFQAAIEQLSRMENKQDRLELKLDRILERVSFGSNRNGR